LEVFGFAVVAADAAAVAQQPGQAGLDDPAVLAEAAGGLDAFAGDPHGDAAAADLGTQGGLVVGLIGVQLAGSVAWPAADRGGGVQQWHHQREPWVFAAEIRSVSGAASVAQDVDL
jgi:hypothetical protein